MRGMKQEEAVTLFREARALYHDARYDEALALFERLAREHPANTGMWSAHAWCLAKMGRHDEARELCRRLKKAGDARAAEIVKYLDANAPERDRSERPKNPETAVRGVTNVPPLGMAAAPVVIGQGPRTWPALGAIDGRVPGGVRCARITLVVVAGTGVLALVFSFLMSAMLLQRYSVDGAMPTGLIALITLVLTFEFLVTCLASLGWQQVLAGKIGLPVAVASLLFLVFPLGTAASVLILMGLFDSDSSKWLQRTALARSG